MIRIGRLVVSAAAFSLGVVVAVGDERGGMPLESRGLVLLGLVGLLVSVWAGRAETPAWVLVTGGISAGLWVALSWSWSVPVESSTGTCGSTLARQQPADDVDGFCDVLVAEAYNEDIPLMLLAVGSGVSAGAGVLWQAHGRARREASNERTERALT